MNFIGPQQAIVPEVVPARDRTKEGPGSRILVVEDEDFVREVTCEVLLSAGYAVSRARTAAEAVRLFPRGGEKLQLLLTDIVLPGRSGQALALVLRGFFPELKTIFISGYPEPQIDKPVSAEADAFYLAKPFSAEMLLGMVGRVLRLSEDVCVGEKIAMRA